MTRDRPAREDDAGTVLLNVLVVLALASAVLVAMLGLSDAAIRRSQTFAEAGAARALLDGAEASAIAVLRRDLREAPGEDHAGEAWARIAQDDIAIDGGRFRLRIEDAQARFNLNLLARGGAAAEQVLARLVAQADLPADTAARIAAAVRRAPLEALDDLGPAAGLDAAALARLAAVTTVLPGTAPVNVNTMPEPLFLALAGNAAEARLMLGLRARAGRLTSADLSALGVVLPPLAGFRSDHFVVAAEATIGGTTVARETLIARRQAEPGRAAGVFVLARRAAVAAAAP